MLQHDSEDTRDISPPRSWFHERGQFGRLFPSLPPFARDTPAVREALNELGRKGGLMDPGTDAARNPDNPAALSAGFTYLGQFIDHDLTFDPTSSLERQVDLEALSNFRTPLLELDNVYGAGPAASPHLYDAARPGRFLIESGGLKDDLPRNSQLTALIGDPRNDENLIVSQLHLAFLKFHNAVVDDLLARRVVPRAEVFREAQRLVRWHYQWMVVNEFLPHIVGDALVQDILRTPRERRLYQWRNEPFMPVEFSVAAYRFGHSQVRAGYRVNSGFSAPVFNATLPLDVVDPEDLRGGKRAERRFVDFNLFFRVNGATPQISKRIDTVLSPPFFELPAGVATHPASLAQRNLLRGLAFGLPSGQDMARALKIRPLHPEDLADVKDLRLDRSTPPWFYFLREAERRTEGRTLGPLGGRIVAEVILGVMAADPLSYLRADPEWKPTLGRDGAFYIGDLLKFAGML